MSNLRRIWTNNQSNKLTQTRLHRWCLVCLLEHPCPRTHSKWMKCSKCKWCTSLKCQECMECQTCNHKCRICLKCSKCNKWIHSTSNNRCHLWWTVWWCHRTKCLWILTCSRCHHQCLRCHRWNKTHSFLWCKCSSLLIHSSSKANKMFMLVVFQKK